MKIDSEIKQFKKFDKIEQIEKFITSLDEEWDLWTHRQKVYIDHGNVKTYPLLWSDENINNNTIDVIKKNKNANIWNILKKEVDFLCEHYDGKIIKMMFTKLPKNKMITYHTDSGFLLINSHRLHLPIVTNKNVYFIIELNSYNMKKGFWYEFDNTKLHSVINDSDEDRIHLILDVIPNGVLNEYNLKVNYIL